jgi:hypothetical protein
MEKFFARYFDDLEGYDQSLTLIKTWSLGPPTERKEEMYWREGEQLFSVVSSSFYEPFSAITKIAEGVRLVGYADEIWLLSDPPIQLPVVPFQAYVSDGTGVLLWDHSRAVWVSPDGVWEVGQVAYDELSFSEIDSHGKATGEGYDAPAGKIVIVVLDVKNQLVIKSAFA